MAVVYTVGLQEVSINREKQNYDNEEKQLH